MTTSVEGSSHSFSRERVRSIYLEGLKWQNLDSQNVPPVLEVRDPESEQKWHSVLAPEERTRRARNWSISYYNAAKDAQQHVSRLDATIALLVRCHHRGNVDVDAVVTRACALLSRLPRTPHPPEGLFANIPSVGLDQAYYLEGQSSMVALSQSTWHKLSITSWFDINTIRLSLMIVEIYMTLETTALDPLKNYIDRVAEILQGSFGLSRTCTEAADQQYWVLAQSFLWTCWSRALLLYFSYNLDVQIRNGYRYDHNRYLGMQKPLPENATDQSPFHEMPEYMCTWAFELLRSDRASILQDFRRFHTQFSAVHGQKLGRCVAGSSRPCNGQGPKHCQRFTGMKIIDQSAHDFGCNGDCKTLFWDEDSYRSVVGARAVSIRDSNGKTLRYCQASGTTIAVSHVWAHGAGGRPHTGFNVCLHDRMVQLAGESSCDSYWMDTPCIPENHDLRAEAISNINKVFTISRMTLIWDRDIMSIDISQASIKVQESILCTLLVCDWNIRSWTLLESMRARHNVHLLCKDNRIISLSECLLNVHKNGAVDIATLFLTNQHLLPALRANLLSQDPDKSRQRVQDGYISVEECICLLAYRHASRPGDSTVIMSLLHDTTPAYTAEAFWKSRIGSHIRTGLLFSSQPRLQCKGFHWAPVQPEVLAVAISADSPKQQQHLLFDGSDTEMARITSGGLWGAFATFDIPRPSRQKQGFFQKRASMRSGSSNEQSTADPALERSRQMTATVREQFQLEKYRHALMLLPLSDAATSGFYRAFRGRSNGAIFAVVGANDVVGGSEKEERAEHRRRWHWLGLFEWYATVPWPKLRNEKQWIFLV
ncbi:MAG: hypothetical protein Q9160_000187 [Pyrenula sp. 1 TL-2023]